jgi:hypothetical protein
MTDCPFDNVSGAIAWAIENIGYKSYEAANSIRKRTSLKEWYEDMKKRHPHITK